MKKLLALLLAVAMVLSLAACGGNGGDTTTKAPATEGEKKTEGEKDTTAAPADDIDTSEHVVIQYMTTGDKPQKGCNDEMLAEVNKLMTEKINAEVQIYWISWTDYLANYNLTLARMDGTVDMIGSSTDWLDAWPNAKNGAFLELSEEMLQKYCPQTWALSRLSTGSPVSSTAPSGSSPRIITLSGPTTASCIVLTGRAMRALPTVLRNGKT